jgi:hypothetical protein
MNEVNKFGIAVVGFAALSACSSSDDGVVIPSVGAQISQTAVLSDTQAYLVRYESYGDNSLYRFNPTTGDVEADPVDNLVNVDIRSIELSPSGDLWVGLANSSSPSVAIIDTADDSLISNIDLNNDPANITFVENSGSSDCDPCAVITGVASDFSSSSLNVADTTSPFDVTLDYVQTPESDIDSTGFKNAFYRIGRFGQDNISKYDFDNPGITEWEFSVGANSNPYGISFVSESKAYVLRYGAGEVWEIDTTVSAGNSAGFKTDEIDLSAYDADGVPEMVASLLANGVLYIITQGQNNFVPGQGYLIAIDTATNTEIDISPADASVDGLALSVVNPIDIDLHGDIIYVTGVGRYFPVELTGGIQRFDINTKATSVVLED